MNRDSKHSGDYRGFSETKRAYYFKSLITAGRDFTDEITIGLYSPDGGTSGEFAIRWYGIAGKSVPCLEIYDDAWSALSNMCDLINALSSIDDENATPAVMSAILIRLGFKDVTAVTPSVSPSKRRQLELQQSALAKLTEDERRAIGLKSWGL